jgi:regulator of nucleoside diphosphate kinase
MGYAGYKSRMNTVLETTPTTRPAIVIADRDARRLDGLLDASAAALHDAGHLRELRAELDRAIIVSPEEIPAGVITMDSTVMVEDLTTGMRRQITLVYPTDANSDLGRISVLAPLGTALLGFREGDEVEWPMPGGLRHLRIERVWRRHEDPVRH